MLAAGIRLPSDLRQAKSSGNPRTYKPETTSVDYTKSESSMQEHYGGISYLIVM
jgi:hypothetical protein